MTSQPDTEDLTWVLDCPCPEFAGLADEQWSRTGRRSDGASSTVASCARYSLHDVVHHLHDVQEPGPR